MTEVGFIAKALKDLVSAVTACLIVFFLDLFLCHPLEYFQVPTSVSLLTLLFKSFSASLV